MSSRSIGCSSWATRWAARAIDAALLHPERVDRILLIGAGVSGMTDEDIGLSFLVRRPADTDG